MSLHAWQSADSSFSISRRRVEYRLKIAATVRHALDAHCLTDDAKQDRIVADRRHARFFAYARTQLVQQRIALNVQELRPSVFSTGCIRDGVVLAFQTLEHLFGWYARRLVAQGLLP